MKRFNFFFKIYLSFWLTTIITVGALVYMERLMTTEPAIKHWRQTVHKTISFYAEEAAANYDQNGTDALRNYFSRLEKATGIQAYLLDEKGNDVAGRTVPGDIKKQALASANHAAERPVSADSDISVERVVTAGKNTYLFAAAYPHPRPPFRPPGPPPGSAEGRLQGPPPDLPPGFFPGRPPGPPPHGFDLHFFIRLIIELIVSGLVCYLLARYLTAPIIKMSNAARQMAAGNFSVRVGPAPGGRRDELSSLAHDFDLMAERIEVLLTSQRNLLRDVSHELRSPLARLNVALELCRQRFGEQAAKDLDRIGLEAGKLNDLIGQILAYNRIETQASEIETASIDLALLIEEIVMDANYETHKDRTVIIDNEAASVTGNRDLLRRAIENIVRNALYHTPEDSRVEIRSQIQSHKGKDEVVISVRDYGRGVPRDALSLIFKPFYKIAETPEHNAGSGLGLAISHTAIRLHGGSITAENVSTGGLMMEIILPANPPEKGKTVSLPLK